MWSSIICSSEANNRALYAKISLLVKMPSAMPWDSGLWQFLQHNLVHQNKYTLLAPKLTNACKRINNKGQFSPFVGILSVTGLRSIHEV